MKAFSLKYLLLFAALMLTAVKATGQVGELRNNFSIGINGGVNLSSAALDPKDSNVDRASATGFAGGITARYISEKYFAMICGLQMELNYVQRGWKETMKESDEQYSRTMNYLEIPFLAHLAFGKERGARFFLNLGPQVAFLLSESETFANGWDTSYGPEAHYHKKADKKFDYGIVGGGGLEIRTGIGNFLLEGRYYFGLSDFLNTTKKDYYSRAAHSTIMGRVTFLFDISK